MNTENAKLNKKIDDKINTIQNKDKHIELLKKDLETQRKNYEQLNLQLNETKTNLEVK